MPEWVWLVLIALALVVGAAAAWFYFQQQRTHRLRQRFGPEYDHSVRALGDRHHAERELQRREERVEHLEIRPLEPEDRERFLQQWQAVQGRFVDEPRGAIAEADDLVAEVMRARGYPVADFEQRAADISVDHPAVVENYRAANEIARRSDRGEADTEELRQAMVHYRVLFEDLLETEAPKAEESRR
jgi:hypothetical protein